MNTESAIQFLVSIVQAMLRPASAKLGDFHIEGSAVTVLPAVIALIVFSVWSSIWLYFDARDRKKSGLLAVIFVFITGWPFSFLWWFWLRPNKDQ